ncbi:hypothetical protein OEZ85_003217 [Tetradesmus obliquus]|uniref:Uncharacterized protein n=1 Tax=Tetradesmus obliquus TaxID=3088 RepID=A0ABY8TZY7_TETOB|nr:hypothetical protein OEZ85_003217 [Tetradesmus obliquus]
MCGTVLQHLLVARRRLLIAGAGGFLRYLVVTHNPEHGIMGVTSSNLLKHGSEVSKLSWAGDAAGVGKLANTYPELLQFCSYGKTTCWHLAARAGAADVLAVLVSRAEDLKYRHCLEQRLSRQQLPKQQQESLIQEMANARNCCYVTPLMMAAESGCADSVRLLLQQGANPWAVDDNGDSALHHANSLRSAPWIVDVHAEQWQHRGHPDPRLLEDRTHCLPYQLALRHNNAALAECLDPCTPLASLFGEAATQQLPASVLLGPASLAQLARVALHRKLKAELESLQDQAEPTPVSRCQKGRRGGAGAVAA